MVVPPYKKDINEIEVWQLTAPVIIIFAILDRS